MFICSFVYFIKYELFNEECPNSTMSLSDQSEQKQKLVQLVTIFSDTSS